MAWIARPADARITSWLERDGPLLTVHGLGGSGTSSSALRALAGRAVVRVDLEGLERAPEIRNRLRALPRAELVFVDQVHHPRAARAAIERLLERSHTRVVVSARAPLGSELEHRVPLGLLDPAGARALVAAELERLGVDPLPDLEGLVRAADGWPLAARAAAMQARVLGTDSVHAHGLANDAACQRVLSASTQALRADRRAMLEALSFAQAALDAHEVAKRFDGGLDALAELVDRGLAIADDGLVRLPRPVAAFVRLGLAGKRTPTAKRRHAALVLEEGERARAAHRQDPIGRGAVLERLRGDLGALALDADPELAVRAALALEPLAIGRLARRDALLLWGRARTAAARLDERARADVALGLARTLIARGDHESAERVLLSLRELASRPIASAYRSIYLGHIAAWRGACDKATILLDEAERILDAAEDDVDDAREDALLQRVFVAHQRGDLDEADRIARSLADREGRPPSPRIATLARSFSAEVMIDRCAPARAVPLLRQTRDELAAQGDHAGAVFLSSRLVEALEAAGDHAQAADEANAARIVAVRAGEGTLEVALLSALDTDRISLARVADLAWRVQIPVLREQAERWLAERAQADVIVLRLDRSTSIASIGGRSLNLARRETLWRVLDALASAHARVAACDCETLFRVGWSGDRAEPTSQRKRVQTAVWTLRRSLLGEVLLTHPQGYALAPEIRIERVR